MMETDSSANNARYFPKRVVVAVLLFFASNINYLQRTTFAIAVLAIKKEMRWNEATQGLVLSAFFWGYICTNIMGGWLAQRVGGRTIAFFSALGSSPLYLILPFCIRTSLPLTIVVHVLIGALQGVFFPCMYEVISKWYPEKEHASVASIFNLGTAVGNVMTLAFGPEIIQCCYWDSVFFITGGCGIVWCILWFLIVSNRPIVSGNYLIRMDLREIHYIRGTSEPCDEEVATSDDRLTRSNSSGRKAKKVNFSRTPWRRLILSTASFALFATHFAGNWGAYVMQSWLPTYLNEALHFEVLESGLYSILPFAGMALAGIIGGWTSDFIVNRGILSKLRSRQFFNVLCTAVPSLCLILLAFIEVNASGALVLLNVAITFLGFSAGSYDVNSLDLTQKHTGLLFSISNTFASIPGVVGVYIVGVFLDNTSIGWKLTFLLSSGILLFSMLFFIVFGRVDNSLIDGPEEGMEQAEQDQVNESEDESVQVDLSEDEEAFILARNNSQRASEKLFG